MNRYPRETTEQVKFEEITYNGAPQTDFTYALTQGLERPDEWLQPIDIGDDKGFPLNGGMDNGYWKVWVKTSSGVVIFVDRFELT